jgi:hypothetical protein
MPKSEANYLKNLAVKLLQYANNIVWIRLDDYKYPITTLYLPEKYRKLALCEAHNHQFGVTTLHLKPTFASLHHTTGLNFGRSFLSTWKLASNASIEKIHGWTSTTTTSTNSGQANHQGPCGSIRPNAHGQMTTQIHFVHHRFFHQVCVGHSSGKQRSRDSCEGHFYRMVLLIRHPSANSHRWWERVWQQAL